MLRRSFRNWFQPHYQYVYAGFRCVSRESDESAREHFMLTHAITAEPVLEFAADVRAGLTKAGQKELPSKYLYDDVGSALFEVISVLPRVRPDPGGRAPAAAARRRDRASGCPGRWRWPNWAAAAARKRAGF